jgi:3-mercaptopyruvate sulfurtransferase SseA
MSQRKRWISLITGAALLVFILACNFVAPDPAQSPAFPTENPHLDIERVTLEEAKAAFDSGAAVFVDVRSESSYAERHIPGALSIPANIIESRMDELDPDQWIITYCT